MTTPNPQSVDEFRAGRRAMIGYGGALAGGAALGAMIPRAHAGEIPGAVKPSGAVFDVMQFGAQADGKADDTAPAQAAIDAAVAAKGGCVYFPAGTYRITRSLKVNGVFPIDIAGSGFSTRLLHENPEPVFHWPKNIICTSCSFRDFQISSVRESKPDDVPVILLEGGANMSTTFSNLILRGSPGAAVGSGVRIETVVDTVNFINCLFWDIGGIGIHLPEGCEVRIFGSRIVGLANERVPVKEAPSKGTGILMTKNLGGVHIVTTDIIAFHTGMQIGAPEWQRNREIFIMHATFDSCIRGLWIRNAGYVSIAGCWTASSDEAQIILDPSEKIISNYGCTLVVSGGTIGNGGAYGRGNSGHGLVARGGTFVLSGVAMWYNRGTGILVEGDGVDEYAVTGCQIRNSGIGAVLRGKHYLFANNVMLENETHIKQETGDKSLIGHNVYHPALNT